ncbi:hypothetical protein DNR46_35175 [Mesorhizobium japonicum]|uniref:Uncharacterized protein n=1 Tax=Mesorhizobium japonicum TaxID=2066070 RepID=A0A3M9WZP2_9HYPH|nr:hypothetical protein DNR46_35175 [Mesorhizobium japonicum]
MRLSGIFQPPNGAVVMYRKLFCAQPQASEQERPDIRQAGFAKAPKFVYDLMKPSVAACPSAVSASASTRASPRANSVENGGETRLAAL